MKNIFLSFRPEYFRPILYGIKKYEYRKRFCNEATTAFLYMSSPIQEVIGVMKLEKPIITTSIINNYSSNSEIFKRIERCIENRELFAIPIISFKLFKTPVSINNIKEIKPNFFVPQCYLNIEKHQEVFNYLKKQDMFDIEFFHNHESIYEDNFGLMCVEMEKTEEFLRKDIQYANDKKYSIVKCKYLTK